ncbi:hypothetical protein ACFQWA_27820 [Streptomyces thermogriseus]|uniref:Uncharacterized protein n=1 Tax=Streptomyces thermogriseus TaxID=75292 RepID=A0ABN1T0T8_9ACTN
MTTDNRTRRSTLNTRRPDDVSPFTPPARTAPTDYTEWRAAALLALVRSLTVSVMAGNLDHVPDLAAAAGALQRQHDWPMRQGARGPRPDSGLPHVDLMRRVVWGEASGFLAVTAGEIRRAMGTMPLAGLNLCTVPAELPADDDAPVCLYSGLTAVGALLSAITRGEDPSGAHKAIKDRVDRRPVEC